MRETLVDPGAVNELVALMEQKLGKHAPARRADLRVVKPMTAQERATEAWQWHDLNMPPANCTDIDQSPRARNLREINRIAMTYAWGAAVSAWLDRAHAESVNSLDDQSVAQLAEHMRTLVDCAQAGCDMEHALPAR